MTTDVWAPRTFAAIYFVDNKYVIRKIGVINAHNNALDNRIVLVQK